MTEVAQVFEMIMLVCFGVSWPFNIAKSIRSRTAKGKSLIFGVCVIVGYLSGLIGKFISGNITYVVAFYLLDISMVAVDFALTCRNRVLDNKRDALERERAEKMVAGREVPT